MQLLYVYVLYSPTVLSIPISEVHMVYSCNSLTEGTVLHMIKNPQHRIA